MAIQSSPWGAVQHEQRVAEGITYVSTAGHGGYRVTQPRLKTMPPELQGIMPFAGPGWYEHDLDWVIVALAWPDHFPPHVRAAAVRTARTLPDEHYMVAARHWLLSPAGQALRTEAEAWEREHADHYAVSASGTIPRRYEHVAERLLPDIRRQHGSTAYLSWAALRGIVRNSTAEALLLPAEVNAPTVRLADIPAERVLRVTP